MPPDMLAPDQLDHYRTKSHYTSKAEKVIGKKTRIVGSWDHLFSILAKKVKTKILEWCLKNRIYFFSNMNKNRFMSLYAS